MCDYIEWEKSLSMTGINADRADLKLKNGVSGEPGKCLRDVDDADEKNEKKSPNNQRNLC